MNLKTEFLDWHAQPAETTIEQDCEKLIEITKIFSISFTKWVNENYVKTISTYTQKDKLYWDADNFTLEVLFHKFSSEHNF